MATAHEEPEAEQAEATALTKLMDEHAQRAAHAEAKVSELSQRIHELESSPDLTPALEEVRAAIDAARNNLKDRDEQFAVALNELVAVRTSLQSANARARRSRRTWRSCVRRRKR
jgi:chromosome segregation ATPase